MSCTTPLLASCLVGLAVFAATLPQPAGAQSFAAFGEDEDVCRRAGTAAIKGGAGPEAARRYDFAYRNCMIAHGRARQMGAYGGGPPGAYPRSNPHGFEYPDAFYSVPYATPGYGYDGFSY